jgi:hypothetical protein
VKTCTPKDRAVARSAHYREQNPAAHKAPRLSGENSIKMRPRISTTVTGMFGIRYERVKHIRKNPKNEPKAILTAEGRSIRMINFQNTAERMFA